MTAAERYYTASVYISRDTYEPKGICYGASCTAPSISVSTTSLTDVINQYSESVKVDASSAVEVRVRAYVSDGSDTTQRVTAYVLNEKSGTDCTLYYPPCIDITTDESVRWKKSGDFILAEMPLAEHCAIDSFQTIYPDGSIRTYTPGAIGASDGQSIEMTFDDGGLMYHRTSLTDAYLIPGEPAHVYYHLRGTDGYHHLGYIDFQTNIFTTAEFLGCGLAKRHKVYNDPLKPEDGYTYKYIAYEGGTGEIFQDQWAFETDYRVCLGYRGAEYWLRSTDFTEYRIGERVAVIKSTNKMPLTPDEDISQSDADNTLSETYDMALPEHFYGRL